jgi:hypothetical protein
MTPSAGGSDFPSILSKKIQSKKPAVDFESRRDWTLNRSFAHLRHFRKRMANTGGFGEAGSVLRRLSAPQLDSVAGGV